MIVASINTGFWSMPLKDMVALFLLSIIPTLTFLIGFLFMIKSQEHVRTLEFLIHKYDRWSLNDNAYKTYYIVEQVILIENFTYYKYTGDSIAKKTQKELEEHCKSLTGNLFVGHETQEEAMREIIENIKGFISHDKAKDNVKITNISTLETFTVEELKEKFKAKEFDYLYKLEQDEEGKDN